ncbi:MAG: hypothetical protein ACRCZF_00720 [Gemmataceae bacterium]
MTMVSVTFTKIWGGFGKGHGILRDEGEFLALEYRLEDNIFGWIKTPVQTVRLPVKELAEVLYHNNWLNLGGGRIELRSNRLATLEHVPGAVATRVYFVVDSASRADAKQFVDQLHQQESAAKPT